MIAEDDDTPEPAPTPTPIVRVLAILAGQLPPDEIPEHDAPPARCGCGWCGLKPGTP